MFSKNIKNIKLIGKHFLQGAILGIDKGIFVELCFGTFPFFNFTIHEQLK
jgi:hypothetical protein